MVRSRNAPIEWTLLAREDMKNILQYYKSKSEQGFQLVKEAITTTVISASKSPELFKEDELKKDNDGTVRVFTVYHIRVAYQIKEDGILVLRLRHTSREPEEY